MDSARAPFSAIVSNAARPAVARNNGCGESGRAPSPRQSPAAHHARGSRHPSRAILGRNAASVRSPASRAISSSDAPCDSGKGSSIAREQGASPRRRSAWYARTSGFLERCGNRRRCCRESPPLLCRGCNRQRAVARHAASSSESTTASISLLAMARSSGVSASWMPAVRFGGVGSGMRWLRACQGGGLTRIAFLHKFQTIAVFCML